MLNSGENPQRELGMIVLSKKVLKKLHQDAKQAVEKRESKKQRLSDYNNMQVEVALHGRDGRINSFSKLGL